MFGRIIAVFDVFLFLSKVVQVILKYQCGGLSSELTFLSFFSFKPSSLQFTAVLFFYSIRNNLPFGV